MANLVGLKPFERRDYKSDRGGIQEDRKYHADGLAGARNRVHERIKISHNWQKTFELHTAWDIGTAVTVYNIKIASQYESYFLCRPEAEK